MSYLQSILFWSILSCLREGMKWSTPVGRLVSRLEWRFLARRMVRTECGEVVHTHSISRCARYLIPGETQLSWLLLAFSTLREGREVRVW